MGFINGTENSNEGHGFTRAVSEPMDEGFSP
jgi:hypothetical protein